MKRSSQRQEEARELVAVLEIRKKNKKLYFPTF
jgi:hypothetical protein